MVVLSELARKENLHNFFFSGTRPCSIFPCYKKKHTPGGGTFSPPACITPSLVNERCHSQIHQGRVGAAVNQGSAPERVHLLIFAIFTTGFFTELFHREQCAEHTWPLDSPLRPGSTHGLLDHPHVEFRIVSDEHAIIGSYSC